MFSVFGVRPTLFFMTIVPVVAGEDAGKPAPPLSLTRILQTPAGRKAGWDAFHGKVTVLEFWATWCDPCITAIPHWNSVVKQFQNRPVQFLSVTDEAPDLIDR